MNEVGGKGKAVLGCSCLTMFIAFFGLLFCTLATKPLLELLPQAGELWVLLGTAGKWLSSGCCCLSSLGVLVGAALLVSAGKKP